MRGIDGDWFERFPRDHPDPALAGQLITRPATCECGAAFEQRILSARFLDVCERHNSGAPLRAVEAQIPGFWCPVFCPRCERVDIGRQAKVDESRVEFMADRAQYDYRRAGAGEAA